MKEQNHGLKTFWNDYSLAGISRSVLSKRDGEKKNREKSLSLLSREIGASSLGRGLFCASLFCRLRCQN